MPAIIYFSYIDKVDISKKQTYKVYLWESHKIWYYIPKWLTCFGCSKLKLNTLKYVIEGFWKDLFRRPSHQPPRVKVVGLGEIHCRSRVVAFTLPEHKTEWCTLCSRLNFALFRCSFRKIIYREDNALLSWMIVSWNIYLGKMGLNSCPCFSKVFVVPLGLAQHCLV